MSDGQNFDFPLGDLTPQQQQALNQRLQGESIPGSWQGTTLSVDIAYEPRVTSLIDEVRASGPGTASPAGQPTPASGGAASAVPPAPAYGAPAPAYGAPAPTYGAPAYGTSGYAAPVGYTAPQKTNGLAIASLVLGIVGLPFCLWFIGGIPALILGYMAKSQIRASGDTEQGRGMALAGIILGWISVVCTVLFIVLWLLLVVFATTTTVKFSSIGSAIN